MGVEKTIGLKVNTSSAEKNVENLKDEFDDLGKSIKKTDKEISDLGKTQKKTGDATKDLTKDVTSNGGAMGILNSLTGGMAQGFKDAYEAIQLSSVGLSGFKKALIATGIGVAVIAIGYLISNWEDLAAIFTVAGRNLKAYNDEQARLNSLIGGIDDQIKLIEAQIKYQESLGGFNATALANLNAQLAAKVELSRIEKEIQLNSAKAQLDSLETNQKEVTFWEKQNGFKKSFDESEQTAIDEQKKKVGELEIAYQGILTKQQEIFNVNKGGKDKTPEEIAAEKAAKEAEALAKALEVRKANDAKLKDLRKKAYEEARNLDASDAIKKKELEKTRALEELIALGAGNKQKVELIAFYDGQIFNLKEEARKKEAEAEKKAQDEANASLKAYYAEKEQIEMDAEDKRLDGELNKIFNLAQAADMEMALRRDVAGASAEAFDVIANIAGEETKLGKAMLIFKQGALLAELAMEVTRTIAFSTQALARSTVAVAEGTAQTAKVGFPQNIPLLIGYAAQAAGIISAIVSATKTAGATGGGGQQSYNGPSAPTYNIVGTSSVTQATQAELSSQDRDTYNQPVQTYITTAQVTTALALQRQIASQSQLGS